MLRRNWYDICIFWLGAIYKLRTLKIGTSWTPSLYAFGIFLYRPYAFGVTPPPSERTYFINASLVCSWRRYCWSFFYSSVNEGWTVCRNESNSIKKIKKISETHEKSWKSLKNPIKVKIPKHKSYNNHKNS